MIVSLGPFIVPMAKQDFDLLTANLVNLDIPTKKFMCFLSAKDPPLQKNNDIICIG